MLIREDFFGESMDIVHSGGGSEPDPYFFGNYSIGFVKNLITNI